jgi:hypothetical protein
VTKTLFVHQLNQSYVPQVFVLKNLMNVLLLVNKFALLIKLINVLVDFVPHHLFIVFHLIWSMVIPILLLNRVVEFSKNKVMNGILDVIQLENSCVEMDLVEKLNKNVRSIRDVEVFPNLIIV